MIPEALSRLTHDSEVFRYSYYGMAAGVTAESFALLLNAVLAVAAPSLFGLRSLALATGMSAMLVGVFLWHLSGERSSVVGPMAATAAAGYIFNPWTPTSGVVAFALVAGSIVSLGYMRSNRLGGALFTALTGLGLVTAFYIGLATASSMEAALAFFGVSVETGNGIRGWAIASISLGSVTAVPLFSAYYAGGLRAAVETL